MGARAGRAAGVAHLQSKMRSVASSFQSSGMLIVDEEAASHWAHDRLLGDLMCPASWPFWMHDAMSQCLLGNVPLRALPSDRRSPAVWGHRTPAGAGQWRALRDRCVGTREAGLDRKAAFLS